VSETFIHDSESPVELCDDLTCDMHHDTTRARVTRGIHRWFCGEGVKHGDEKRPAIGWACERGASVVLEELDQ
jgi:hypothetical protein